MRALLVGFLLLAGSSCEPMKPVTVVHVPKHAPAPVTEGDKLRLTRPSAEAYGAVRSGAFVVRDLEDWQKLWKGAADPPAFPPALEARSDMLFFLATEDAIVTKVRVVSAIESASQVVVRVRQTMLGEGCVRRPEERAAIDVVSAPRLDKPVKFVVEDEDGPSCGEPPRAGVTCRMAASESWAPKLTAKMGDVVECELTAESHGKYELVDQGLTLADTPPGSNAKLKYGKARSRATLAIDAYGTYAVRAEATDEAGRKGRATALIDVAPKKSRDVLLELTWSAVDAGDYTLPPPRVILRVTQEGPRGQRCSSEIPVPGLCDARTRGSYTHMRIPASKRKLPVSLLYLDERPQDGPAPCLNVWFDGQKTATVCDRDHRHAEDRWELGTLETGTGKMQPPKPAAPKP